MSKIEFETFDKYMIIKVFSTPYKGGTLYMQYTLSKQVRSKKDFCNTQYKPYKRDFLFYTHSCNISFSLE